MLACMRHRGFALVATLTVHAIGSTYVGGNTCSAQGILDELAKLDPFTPHHVAIDQVPPAKGAFIHNRTNQDIYYCILYKVAGYNSINVGAYDLPVSEPDRWRLIGWFKVPAQRSVHAIQGDLNPREFYFYGYHANKQWGGDVTLWVDPQQKFLYNPEDKNDLERRIQGGYVRRGFKKFEMGNEEAWHVNLVD
jgi:uncharacterized membrane protein